MTGAAARPAPARAIGAVVAALAVTPGVLALGFALLPAVHLGEAATDAVAAGWACTAALAGLGLAARHDPPRGVRPALLAIAAAVLVAVAVRGVGGLGALVAVGGALVAGAWALGDGIGRRIAHPGHVGPACAVAAAADVVSVVAPEGPTHAIAASDAALSVLAIAGPVPGHLGAAAPTLGAGDLVFTALLLGAAAKHGVARGRVVLATAIGIAAALGASAALAAAVPALPAIGAAAIALVPRFRHVRPSDRAGARLGVALALGLALAAVARRLIAG